MDLMMVVDLSSATTFRDDRAIGEDRATGAALAVGAAALALPLLRATPRTPAGPFSGDPSTLLDGGEEDTEEDGGVEAEEGDAPAAPAPKPERFREVHRLAFVVECACGAGDGGAATRSSSARTPDVTTRTRLPLTPPQPSSTIPQSCRAAPTS